MLERTGNALLTGSGVRERASHSAGAPLKHHLLPLASLLRGAASNRTSHVELDLECSAGVGEVTRALRTWWCLSRGEASHAPELSLADSC